MSIVSLDELRDYVQRMLCDQNQLEVGAFPLTERILMRQSKPCGIYYALHGPRNVKLTAIWETDRNTIIFYTSTGERRQMVQLTHASADKTVLTGSAA